MAEPVQLPELMDFQGILKNIRVVVDDDTEWLEEGLNTAIAKAVKKAYKYAKACKVNLELKFSPGQMNQIEIDATLNMKEPKASPLTMVAYTDNKGRLFGEDPQQTKLPLDRTVEIKRNQDA